jgi:hypothetical protein
VRRIRVLAGLTLVVALPAAAHTFGFSASSTAQACLVLGNTTYRIARSTADVTVRIEPSAVAPTVRIELAETPDQADFVLVDDGAPPTCAAAANVKSVSIATGTTAPDLVVGFATGSAPADYRIYVRSRWIAPETAAALFAAGHRPAQRLAGATVDRSN